MTACVLLFADTTGHWYPDSFGMAMLSTLTFGAVGVVLAILGFKLLDLLTPGKLQVEILEKQNLAAAILVGAMVLGICIIVAAAVG
jgi:putative membrane protein